MSTMPEGMSGFVREPDAYDVDEVLENVVWPLVDHIWHRGERTDEWLEDTEAGDSINTFRKKKIGQDIYRVALEACADISLEDDEKTISTVRSVTFEIEQVMTGDTREFLMNRAFAEVEKRDKAIRDAGHEDAPSSWPEGPDDQLVVKNVKVYDFNDTGDWSDPHYIEIRGVDKRIEILFDNRDESIDYEMRLHDVEVLELACNVLNAPKAIKKAIEHIKAHPVSSC